MPTSMSPRTARSSSFRPPIWTSAFEPPPVTALSRSERPAASTTPMRGTTPDTGGRSPEAPLRSDAPGTIHPFLVRATSGFDNQSVPFPARKDGRSAGSAGARRVCALRQIPWPPQGSPAGSRRDPHRDRAGIRPLDATGWARSPRRRCSSAATTNPPIRWSCSARTADNVPDGRLLVHTRRTLNTATTAGPVLPDVSSFLTSWPAGTRTARPAALRSKGDGRQAVRLRGRGSRPRTSRRKWRTWGWLGSA